MITIHEEPKDVKNGFRFAIERCHFCREKTRFWNSSKHYPVRPKCAKEHDESELTGGF